VDADGHILESAKCWEQYCEAKYRAKAIRLKEDEDGLEYLEVNGVPSRVNPETRRRTGPGEPVIRGDSLAERDGFEPQEPLGNLCASVSIVV
jgi:hypothetical protein